MDDASTIGTASSDITDRRSRLDDPRIRALILWSAVLGFTLIVRLRTLETIETSGDPFEYVLAVKELLYRHSDTWVWTHHTARFGIVVPTAFAFWIFGADPLAYYAVPVALALGTSAIVFATARRLRGTPFALLATAALVLFPMMVRNGSQIAPGPFLIIYLSGAAYGYVRLIQASTSREERRWLLVMVALTFLAYLAKVTAVYAVLGFAAALLTTGRWRTALAYVGLLAVLFGAEWLSYSLFSEIEGGRFGLIGQTHLTSKKLKPLEDWWALFARFAKFKGYWLLLFAFSIAAAGYHFTSRRRMRSPAAGLHLVGLCLVFGTVVGVKSIDPIVPAVPLRMRYASPAVPFLLLGGLTAALGLVAGRFRLAWERRGVALAGVLTLALSLIVYPDRWKEIDEHPLRVLNEYRQLAWHHASKGTIVLGTGTHKGATKVMKGYLALLWPYHDDLDAVPEIVRYRIGRRAYYYFTRIPSKDRKARRLEQIKVEKAVRELGPFVLVKRAKEDWNFVRQKHRGYMKIEVFEHGGTEGHMKVPSPGTKKKKKKKKKDPLAPDDEGDDGDDD